MIVFDESLAPSDEIENLAAIVRAGKLTCESRFAESDGDIRYWGVSARAIPALAKFEALAISQGSEFYGVDEPVVCLMINYISAMSCPDGSGGGWHVDSLRPQCKLFCYLTDCETEESGSFCLLRHRLALLEQAAISANWALGNGKRVSDDAVRWLSRLGFFEHPVLAKKGVPFFSRTDRIHRGLPIRSGERIMLTAYIYPDQLPQSILSRVQHNDDGQAAFE